MATLDPTANRLSGIETRLGTVETRLGTVETRLGTVETRLEKVETAVAGLQTDVAGLRGEWRVVKWVLTAFVAPTCITLIGGTVYLVRTLA